MLADPGYDAASALWIGTRDTQEDAVIVDFPVGADAGLIVLSDGMGGHAAGDVASKIVMTEVYSELKFQSGGTADPAAVLRAAALGANACVAAHVGSAPEARGMGATLVAAQIAGGRLHWLSVGDSLLFLYRDGDLQRLNEDHSLAPQLDLMVASGMIDAATAAAHPDRCALTSVIAGAAIARIDCPDEAIGLRDGDIVVVASDGILGLRPGEIAGVLSDNRTEHGVILAQRLLAAVMDRRDPDQDNTSIAVVKVRLPRSEAAPIRPDEGRRFGLRRMTRVIAPAAMAGGSA